MKTHEKLENLIELEKSPSEIPVKVKEISSIIVEEPILNILSSNGRYNPLEGREEQIPQNAQAYRVEEIETVMENPFQIGMTDYKKFKITFYRIESHPKT